MHLWNLPTRVQKMFKHAAEFSTEGQRLQRLSVTERMPLPPPLIGPQQFEKARARDHLPPRRAYMIKSHRMNLVQKVTEQTASALHESDLKIGMQPDPSENLYQTLI